MCYECVFFISFYKPLWQFSEKIWFQALAQWKIDHISAFYYVPKHTTPPKNNNNNNKLQIESEYLKIKMNKLGNKWVMNWIASLQKRENLEYYVLE